MYRIAALVALASLAALPAAAEARTGAAGAKTYLVLYKQGASVRAAHRAIHRAGGTIVRENRIVGLALVRGGHTALRAGAARRGPLAGVAANRSIGRVRRVHRTEVERRRDRRAAALARTRKAVKGEPFGPLQWDMKLIKATPRFSYRVQQGSHAVRVGVIDTGVDGTHPDIAPNFDKRLSRNFTHDDPVIDGPCKDDIDHSCKPDPANVDEDGHGTHVAGTIGAALNGLGMAGVAPKVDLVNLRAGQDSGYFFIMPTVDALTYAANHGIDVVNMSYYVDPWLFNCRSNPADSPAEQREQRIVIGATTRALNYAHRHGVTLIAAEGNESTDLGHPASDDTSPDYPDQDASPHPRTINDGCLSEPSEGPHVINVSAVGPSQRKAFYSNYGLEQTDVAAPGGDSREFFGTKRYKDPKFTEILAPYPRNVAVAAGDVDGKTGKVTKQGEGFVLADRKGGRTAYYQYLQGTSMASPHAVGVAAILIARYGTHDRRHGGVRMNPNRVGRLLEAKAIHGTCPTTEPFHYPGEPAEEDATCVGTSAFNGFYGHGIVNAQNAARY